jgi:ATP-dependent RNA helicase RhlB
MIQPSILMPADEKLMPADEKPSHLTNQRFNQFDLLPELLKGVDKAGFHYCTDIQAETLPLVLAGTDVAGQAHTGTGKTAAFLLAIYQRLLKRPLKDSQTKNSVRAVVLAPTRELAIQIHNDAQILGAFTSLRLGLVYGGTAYQKQREDLAAGVDILIGTPGRLIDYFKQGIFNLKSVEVVVLDEADRMFDLGFIKDIRYVLRRMPPPDRRLNMLFSATLSYRIKELAYEHMNDPRTVTIASSTPVASGLIEQIYYPANSEKLALLLGILDQTRGKRMLIFANTRNACDRLGRELSLHNYSNGVLSGQVPQRKRESLLLQFKNGEKQILVATDVAARGLHIPHVSHVFNYDLPQDPEDYVHRIGRTARAGASGYAISFACEEHALSLMDIESFIGHQLEKMEICEDLLNTPKPKMPEQSSSHKKKIAREPRSNAKKVYKKQLSKKAQGIQSKIAANQIDLTQQDKDGDVNTISAYTKKSENTTKSPKKNGTPAQQASPEIPAIG